MKKLLFSLVAFVALVTVAGFASFAENKADIEGTKAVTSYSTTTTTDGWVLKNAAFVSIDGVYAPTLNGKTSGVGSITSPTLTGGLSQISFNYTNTYSESNGVSLKIEVMQGGKAVDSETLTNTNVTTKTVYTFESKAFNVEGDFQIVITNLSPSKSTSNKDRVSIWNLTWTNYSAGPGLSPAGLSFAETNFTVTLGDEFTAPELTKATTADAVYSSSNEAVATVDATTGAVTLVGVGETTITATCAETEEYEAGEVSYTLTVLSNLKEAGLVFPEAEYTVTLGEEFTAPELTRVTTADPVYSSSNTEVATVDAVMGTVTILSVGETTITAKCPETEEYQAGEASYKLVVNEPVNENQVKEVLTATSFGVSGTTYKPVTYTSPTTGIVYTANMAGDKSSIQLRVPSKTTQDDSGIVVTKNDNGYKVKSIEVVYNSDTADKRTLDVYGKDSNYASVSDLYDTSTAGTKEGSIVKGSEKPVDFATPTRYFGVRSSSGAMYIESITIIYEKPSGVVLKEAELKFPEAEYTVTLGEEFTAPELTRVTTADPVYSSSNTEVATVDEVMGTVTILAVGETTITATCPETEEYQAGEASYKLVVNEPVNENEVEEVLTVASFGSPSNYSDVEYTSSVTGIVYKGQMTTNNGNIQIRATNPSGIVINENKNGYEVKSIEVVYASSTTGGRTLDVYGKDSNYSSAADLYSTSTSGTKEGSIKYQSEKPVDFATPTLYFGVRSNNGALYIKSITIIYEKPSGDVLKEPALEFPAAAYTATIGEEFTAPVLSKATTADAVYVSSNPAVATVDAATGEVTLVSFGETVITATCAENDEYRAGTASYTLTVDDPSVKVIYSNDLKSDSSEFTFQTNEGDVEPWSIDATYGLKATAYTNGSNKASDATAVSPVLDLTSYVAPIRATFQQAGNFFGDNGEGSAISDYCSVMVRESDETEFTDKVECAMPTANSWNFAASEVDLSAYAGKKIQLGFRYTSTDALAGTWEIKDLVVKGKEGLGVGVEGIAADDAEVAYYTLQGQRVVNPDKGIYIRVRGGKADKVMF